METKKDVESLGTVPYISKNFTLKEPTLKALSSKLTPSEMQLEKSIPMEINEIPDRTEVNFETSKTLACEKTEKPTVAKPSAATFLTEQQKVNLPENLTIPMIQEQAKSAKLENSQPREDSSSLRSENAKTSEGEELYPHPSYLQQQQEEIIGSSAADQLENNAEEAEEASALGSEKDNAEIPLEEEKEPEFDYHGCEICKADEKQCDRSSFTHMCPICPCLLFCAHLLKEHMKVVHGWFNVQRRFTQF